MTCFIALPDIAEKQGRVACDDDERRCFLPDAKDEALFAVISQLEEMEPNLKYYENVEKAFWVRQATQVLDGWDGNPTSVEKLKLFVSEK